MTTESELDRNAIFEKFASIKRMHVEVGRKQTEDYQKRLDKLKEEESNYMARLLSQPQEDQPMRNQTSARRDLFLSSKNDFDPLSVSMPQHQPISSKPSSRHHPLVDREWNIDDDIQPLNITDNDTLDNHSHHDEDEDREEAAYITAYQQLLHTQQQLSLQPEAENMLSTILEASCEEPTPMTSLVDIHQPRAPISDDDEELTEEEETEQLMAPSIDDLPVSTVFSKNQNLKYSDYIQQKLQVEKDQAFSGSSAPTKEKRPFLRRREGLAHFQAPPKRRQIPPETNKRPSSASARPRAPVAKAKPAKPSIPSNLLGQVDLDDDEDLHLKHSAKKKTIESLIESKWNAHQPEEELYSTRQRTSSRSSGTVPSHHRQDLDDFEKLEQYAEEHPSMISTASYVDQVVLKEHSHFVQRLAEYPEDEEEEERDLTNHRIRQRKIKPLKTHPEPLSVVSDDDDDDDDEEEDRWNDVGVAKVIPVIADEYNSDSGISSLRMDFQKAQPAKKGSSDFGDEHSWVERVTVPAHNSLMLKTFPGLRHTQPSAVVAPPPPPPPPTFKSEPNDDLSRLMREKSKELEKQIEIFQKENSKLDALCHERNLAIKKLKQDREEFERSKQKETEEFQQMREEETKKLKQEKRLFEAHRQQLREHPDKREREEIESLKKQVLALQDDLKLRETRWATTVNRLKERIETLEYENAEVKQEKEIIERKRLDLMHQLQSISKPPPEEINSVPRKSLVELQQSKRPKPTVPSTSKSQSMPKTMVVKNSEPASKAKNGRRTPTNVVGVNGIKNNLESSRKFSSLPATIKRTTTDSVVIVGPERVDSGNGESDEESHLLPRNEDYVSPSLINSEPLDYQSLLTMATRTSSSANTLLKQHQESLTTHSIPRVTMPTAKTITFKEHSEHLQSALEEVRHQDGRIERIKSDHSKTILFPNGSKQEISADGQHIRVYFFNGDYKEKLADGRCIYKYSSTNTTETEYPDGTRVCEFPNGQIEKHLPDGRQEHTLPDRTKNIYLKDGTIITLKTNGEKFIQHTNQTKEIHTETYKRKLFPNGSILTVFHTGEQEVRYANGKIKLKDAQGNVILEKKTSSSNQP